MKAVESVVNGVGEFLNSLAGQEFQKLAAMQRESIINKGKIARKDSIERKMWAELDGFDKCFKLLLNIENYKEN